MISRLLPLLVAVLAGGLLVACDEVTEGTAGNEGNALQDVATDALPSVIRIGTECSGELAVQCVGIGSGWVYDDEGHVVTNNHVVVIPTGPGTTRAAKSITVSTSDGRNFNATLVGRDPATDLALLRVEGLEADALPLVEADGITIGEPVVAIGFALDLGVAPSVTTGVVSAVERRIQEATGGILGAIQTDAAINPGNSGGPLLNTSGEVVGVNTAGISGTEGIGFAVGADTVRAVAAQLEETGSVQRAFLGVSIQNVTPALAQAQDLDIEDGVIILQVLAGSPVDEAGLQAGDVLVAVAGESIESSSDLQSSLIGYAPGGSIEVEYIRDGDAQTTEVAVSPPPER